MKKIISKLIDRWDWFIYGQSFYTFERMARKDGGFAYLMYVYMGGYLVDHPPSPRSKKVTEEFYEALMAEKEQSKSQ